MFVIATPGEISLCHFDARSLMFVIATPGEISLCHFDAKSLMFVIATPGEISLCHFFVPINLSLSFLGSDKSLFVISLFR
jgi:hypothetical protein